MNKKIAIVGGGISGITAAIKFAKNKNNIIHLFEKRDCILKSSPYCHVHAGGILYPEISLLDCQNLLQDSIVFANKFKDCLEYRPTIVAYKKNSKYSTDKLIFKCKVNKLDYFFSKSQIFGQVDNFFAIYTENDIAYYKKHGKMKSTDDIGREYHDTFVEKFCKLLTDIDSIKYPFISVCEPGINQERVENKLIEELQKLENVSIFLNGISA